MMTAVSEHILDELSWRGLIATSTDLDALRKDLDGESGISIAGT